MFEALKGHTCSCQRRSCLKQDISGELSVLDHQNLMGLCCQVEKQACIDDGGINPQPGHASVPQCESTEKGTAGGTQMRELMTPARRIDYQLAKPPR
jgi:hypothetical protein